MTETIEFRIPEQNAAKYLPTGIGDQLTWVRKVEIRADDPLVARIGKLQAQFLAEGKAFFLGWEIHRRYSRRELTVAKLLNVWPKRAFEPAGEECGTMYDEAAACDHVFESATKWDTSGRVLRIPSSTCGVGARQVTSLFLDGRTIPRGPDFVRTIANEIVASRRVVEVFDKHGLSGAEFGEVRLSNQGGAPSREHYQLKVVGQSVELSAETRGGEDPFDESGYGRCPRGHIIGLSLLSEVTVDGDAVRESDLLVTRQMVGVRRGLLRPRPLLLMSARAWRVICDAGLKGLGADVVRLPESRELRKRDHVAKLGGNRGPQGA